MYEREEFPNPDETITDDWREGQEGDWVLTDDGEVVQILKRKAMTSTGKQGSWVRTICGTFICRPGDRMDSRLRKNIYSFGGDKTAEEHFRERKAPTRRERLFVSYYLTDIDHPIEAYFKAFPTQNSKWASDQAYKLLRQRRIVQLITETIQDAAKEQGVTEGFIIQESKKAVEGAVGEKKIPGLRFLSELIGIGGFAKETATALPSRGVFEKHFEGFTELPSEDMIGLPEHDEEAPANRA